MGRRDALAGLARPLGVRRRCQLQGDRAGAGGGAGRERRELPLRVVRGWTSAVCRRLVRRGAVDQRLRARDGSGPGVSRDQAGAEAGRITADAVRAAVLFAARLPSVLGVPGAVRASAVWSRGDWNDSRRTRRVTRPPANLAGSRIERKTIR